MKEKQNLQFNLVRYSAVRRENTRRTAYGTASNLGKVFAVVLAFLFMTSAVVGMTLPSGAQAAIPKNINFQGKLTKTSDGTNVANGTYAFEFKLYTASSGGSPVWTETFDQPSGACSKLTVTNGVFNAKLGSCATLSDVDFTGGSLYLSVNFAPTGTSYDGEMSPRKQLVSSAYAFVANSVSGDGVINTANQSTTALTVGRTSTDAALQVDTNTASSATGLKVTSAAAGGGIALAAISSGTNEALTLNAKGTGQISIGSVSSGNINIAGDGLGDVLLGGGNGATGCTLTNSSGNLVCNGTGTFSNLSGTNTGDITLGAFGSSPNANGASLSGQVLTLQPADGSNPGGVSTTTQTFAGNKTFSGNTVFNGTGTFNSDVDLVFAGSENIALTSTITGTTAVDLFSSTVTNQTSSGTQRGIVLTNANDAANAVTENLILIDNAEGTVATLTDAILITSSGVDGGIVDAIDVSAANIDNAINIGGNAIAGTNFNVSAAGAVIGVGVNSGTGLLQGTGGLTITGTTQINATGTAATTIGSAAAGALVFASDSNSSFTVTTADLDLATATSGNINLTTGAAAGLVNILSGNLKVGNGTPDTSLNGEDAYIEGTLEVDSLAGSGTRCLQTDNLGNVTVAGAACGSGSVAWNSITNPTGTQTLTFDDAELNSWTVSSDTETFWTTTANSLTSGTLLSTSATGLTTGYVQATALGSALTTGGALNITGASYNHTAGETGNLINIAYTDATTNAVTSTTTGMLLSPTINAASGAATRTINGISIAPTFTSCAAGTCAVNGLNIANVTDGTGFTGIGIKIGTGWDTGITVPGAGTDSERFGLSATAAGINSLAIGNAASSGQDESVAIGRSASNTGGSYGVAVGSGAATSAGNTVAIGGSSTASGSGTTVVGMSALADQANGTAIGFDSYAYTGATALGANSNAGYLRSVAIGYTAQVGDDNGISIGYNAYSEANSIALGYGALTNSASSIAIGRAAETTATNQLVFGSSSYPINDIFFGKGVTNATPTAFTINGTGGSGTDIAGAAINIAGGKGTGNAAGGSILFQTSDAGASGTTLQSLTTKATLLASGNFGIGDTSPAALLTVGSGDLFQVASNGNLTSSNAGTWTFSNDTNFVLSGGVNGLSFDSNTLSIDATNDRVAVGSNAPSGRFQVNPHATSTNTVYIPADSIGASNGYGIGSNASGSLTAITGNLIDILITRQLGAATVTDSGRYLSISRNLETTAGGSSFTVSGNLAHLYSNCIQTAGTCTDTSKILALNQDYASASGTVLDILGDGTGNLIAADATNSSANGVSIDVQSSSASQYALRVTTNNAATNSLWVGGDGNVGIGTTAPTSLLHVHNTSSLALGVNASAYTTTIQGAFTEAGSGTHPLIAGLRVSPPTITGGTAAVTDTATLYVSAGTVASGANNFAMFIDGDAVNRIDGSLQIRDNTNVNRFLLDPSDAFSISNGFAIKFGSAGVTSPDVGIVRASAGLLEVNSSVAGSYRDLRVRKLFYGHTTSASAWGLNGIALENIGVTYTDTSTAVSGTATNAVFNSFAQPTLAATNATVTTTNAATVYIADAPAAGTNQTITNPYALWVDNGNVRFDGNLTVSGTCTGCGGTFSGEVDDTTNDSLTFTSDDASAPAGTVNSIFRDNTGDLNINTISGKTLNLQIAGTDEYNFSSTALAMNSNNITGVGTNITATGALTVASAGAGSLNLTSASTSTYALQANAATSFRFTDGTNAYQTINTQTATSGVSAFTFTPGTAPSIASAAGSTYNAFTFTPGTYTFTGTTNTTATGTAAPLSALFNQPTIAGDGTRTITEASNFIINGPVRATSSAGTETITTSYGLNILAGSALNGSGGAVTNAVGLSVNAPTGATNNYAALFNGGNVGIATTAPDYKFQIGVGSTTVFGNTVYDSLVFDSDYPYSAWRTSGGIETFMGADNPGGYGDFGVASNHPLSVVTNSLRRMTVEAGGEIGINTTVADRQLEINSATGNNLRLTYNDADGGATNYADLLTTSAGALTIQPSGFITNIGGGATRTAMRFLEPSGTGTDYAAIQAHSNVTTSYTWSLPAADSSGCIQSDGAGQLSISACGGASSLQAAYDGGNLINTSDARDIDFELADDTTDSNLDIDIFADNTVSITRAATASSEVPAQLLLLENADADITLTNGLLVQTNGGAITDGIEITNTSGNLTNGINIADTAGGTLTTGILLSGTFTNLIDAPNFDVLDSGNITTAGTLAVNGDSITSDGTTLTINASGNVDIQDALNADSITSDAGVSIAAGNSYTGAGAVTLSSGSNGALNITPNGTGDTIVTSDADSNLQLTATAVPGIDMFALSNSGQVITADGVDGISLDFRTGNGTDPTNNAINIALTSGGTAATDILNGIDLTLSGTSGTENGIRFGTGFDSHITTAAGVDLLINPGTTGDVLLAGGSGSTGCTVDNPTGDFACTGTGTFFNLSGTNTGDVTLGAFGSSPNANGASLSGQVLTLQPADGSNPGGVSTTTQTFAGAKTFTSNPTISKIDPSLVLLAPGSDTDFWLSVTDDGGNDDDDLFQIGDGSTPGTNPFLSIDTLGQIGIQQAPVVDYLFALAGTTGNDNSRVIDITQANNVGEDTSSIYITDTSNAGTIDNVNRNVIGLYQSLTPTANIASTNGFGFDSVSVYGTSSDISLANIDFNDSSGSFGVSANTYGNRVNITGAVDISDTNTGGSNSLNIYGVNSQIGASTVWNTSTDTLAYNTYAGYFSNSSSSDGNALQTSTSYGVYAESIGSLTTTGTTTGYAGYFDATGATDLNYGIYVNVSGATLNYAGIFTGGSVGIGTTGPDRKLDILDASNPQLRLTQADGSVYTDFQTDSSGYLTISNTGHQVLIPGNFNGGNLIQMSNTTAGASAQSAIQIGQNFGASEYVEVAYKNTSNGGWGSNVVTVIAGSGAASMVVGTIGSDDLNLYTNNSTRWTVVGSTGVLQANGAQTLQTSTGNLTLATAGGNGHILLTPNGSGNVGVNTTGPDRRLDILDASNPQLRLTQADGSVYVDLQSTSSGVLNITTTAGGGLTLAPALGTSGSPTLLTVTGPAHTGLAADTEASDINYNLARTVQFTAGGGTFTNQRAFKVLAPTYSATSAETITNAATLYVDAAPTAGTNMTITNPYAFWVDGGITRLDGNVGIGNPATIPAKLTIAGTDSLAIYRPSNDVYGKLNYTASQQFLFENSDSTYGVLLALTYASPTGGSGVGMTMGSDRMTFGVNNSVVQVQSTGLSVGTSYVNNVIPTNGAIIQGQVGIGTLTPDARLELAGNITQAAWGLNGIQLQATAATYTDSDTGGTRTNGVANSFGIPTFDSTNTVTITNAANVYVAGAPADGGANITLTNAYALWVDAGTTRLDGDVLGTNFQIEVANNRTAFGTTTLGPAAHMFVNGWSTAQPVLAIKGIASQAEDLLQLQNSGGTVLASIDETGLIQSDTLISGADQCLKANAAGEISGTGSACGSGGSTNWDTIGDPSAGADIAFGTTAQTITSTATTQNPLSLIGNSLTTGSLFSLNSSSTAITSASLIQAVFTGAPAASWTGDLAKFEATGNDIDLDGNILKLGYTNSGAGDGTVLNITSAQTGSSAYIFRANDDGSYTDTSPFVIDVSGNVGIATVSPSTWLDVSPTDSTSNIVKSVIKSGGTFSGTVNSTATLNGVDASPTISSALSGAVTSGQYTGYNSAITFSGSTSNNSQLVSINGAKFAPVFSGTIGGSTDAVTLTGVDATVASNLGTTGFTDKYGILASATGTADNNYGVFTAASGGTNNYSLYLGSLGAGANNYSLYSTAAAQSYFAGSVGIGDASPAALLTVGNGDLFQVNSSGDITTIATENLSVTTGTTGILTLDSGTTGAVNLGTGNNAKTIAIGTGTAGNTINIGTNNTTSDTIAIGSVLDNVSITGDQWSITDAGVLTVVSCSGCGGGGTAWDTIADPSGNGAVNMGTTVQTLDWGATTTTDNLTVTSSATGLTSGSAFKVTSATTGSVTNGIVQLQATANYNGSGGLLAVLANSTTAGVVARFSGTSLTSGTGVSIVGGTAMTTGTVLSASATYAHTTAETGSLDSISVTDNSSASSGTTTTNGSKISVTASSDNSGGTAVVNGLSVATTVDTTGAGVKQINALNVDAPTMTACTSGACTFAGLRVTGASTTNVTSYGMYIDAGTGAGTEYAAAFMNGYVGVGTDTPLDMLQVGSSINRGDLTVYGDITTQGLKDITALTGIKDVYVYDTTADADAGRWIDWSTTDQLSWYTETKDDTAALCNISSHDRCGDSAFPRRAALIVTTDSLYIFDAINNTMWMKFSQNASGYALGADSGNDPSSVTALNGVIYVGTNGASQGGLYVFDFVNDRMWNIDGTDRSGADVGISGRNAAVTYNSDNNTAFDLSTVGTASEWEDINDVSATFITGSSTAIAIGAATNTSPGSGQTFVGLATDSGITVINMTAGKIIQYSDVTADDYTSVVLTRRGRMYALNTTQDQLERWNDYDTHKATNVNGAPTVFYDEAATPALWPAAVNIQAGAPDALEIVERASLAEDTSEIIYVGHNLGLSEIHDHSTTASQRATNAWVKYFDTTRQSMILPNSIDVALMMDDSSGTLADELSSADNDMTMKGSPTLGVSGVRGKAMQLNGTSQYLCSDANADGTCDNDTAWNMSTTGWTLSLWFKHSTSISGNDVLFDKCYNTTPAVTVGCVTIYMNSSGNMVAAIDATTTWTAFTTYDVTATTSLTYNDNQWHHVTLSRTNANDMDVYFDGNPLNLSTATGQTATLDAANQVVAFGADCSAGANCSTGANFWDGAIDDITFSASTGTVATMSALQARRLYNDARPLVAKRVINVTDATTATSTTIGDSGETWIPNEFAGLIVELTGGTGAGQTRRVVSNTTTTLTVSPAFTTTPDTTTDFEVDPEALYGASTAVYALGITGENPLGQARQMCVGTNSGTDTGGVTCYNHQAGPNIVADIFHSGSKSLDDSGVEWTGTDYDDIRSIDFSGKGLLIGSEGHFYKETESVRLGQGLDYLSSQLFNIRSELINDGITAAGSFALEVGFTGGADLAEYYYSKDSLNEGDVVAIDPDGDGDDVVKYAGQYGAKLMGIVASKPAIILGEKMDGAYPIALTGRIPVKFSAENGPVKAGDYLTSSSVAGHAMRATGAGPVLGKALADSLTTEQQQICDTELQESNLEEPEQPNYDFDTEMCGKVMMFAELGDFSGLPIEQLMAELDAELADADLTEMPDEDAVLVDSGDLEVQESKQQKILAFLKQMKETKEDIGVSSQILTDRLSATFEVITPNLVADGLEVQTIGSEGSSIDVLADISFIGRPYFNSDTAGFAKILAGDRFVDITFEREYLEQPTIVTEITQEADPRLAEETDQTIIDGINALDDTQIEQLFAAGMQQIVTRKSVTGFRIMLNKPAPQDISFSWIALAVKQPRLVISDGLGVQTPPDPLLDLGLDPNLDPSDLPPPSIDGPPDSVGDSGDGSGDTPPAEDNPSPSDLPPPPAQDNPSGGDPSTTNEPDSSGGLGDLGLE